MEERKDNVDDIVFLRDAQKMEHKIFIKSTLR